MNLFSFDAIAFYICIAFAATPTLVLLLSFFLTYRQHDRDVNCRDGDCRDVDGESPDFQANSCAERFAPSQRETSTTKTQTTINEISQPSQLSRQLDEQLCTLSVCGYERLIARLLQVSGYEQVRILRDPHVNRRSHKACFRRGDSG